MPIPIPLLFIAIPLVELYFIIVIGEMIGALWTVALVILTAVIGVNLLRIQGMSTLSRAQQNMAQGQIPAMEMLEGVALAVAGVLLITPGFLTDSLGFLCLFPPTRQAMIRAIMSKARIQTSYTAGPGPSAGAGNGYTGPAADKKEAPGKNRQGTTIEGEYTREE